MLYTELKIGEENYKLRLTTKNSIQLERALGYNPIIILHSMLQTYHHGMSIDKVYDLFDAYAEKEGKSMFDLIPVFIEVFQQSGYITKDAKAAEGEESPKN